MEQASADQDGTNGVRRSKRTRNKSTLQNACGKGDIHTSLNTSTKKNKSKIKKPPSASTVRRNYLLMLRRELDRLRKIRKRSLETPVERKARLEQQRLYKMKKRQNETPIQRKNRLEKDSLRKKLVRNGKVLPQPAKLMYQMLISEDGDLPATPQPKIIEHIEKQRLKSNPKSKQPKSKRKTQNKSMMSEDEVLPEYSELTVTEHSKKQRLKANTKSKQLKCKRKTQNKSMINDDDVLSEHSQLTVVEQSKKQRLKSKPNSEQPKFKHKTQNKIKQCESDHQNMLNTEENKLDIIVVKEEHDLLYHQENEKITIEVPQMSTQINEAYHDAEEMPEYSTKNEIPNESEYSPQSNHTHPERLTHIIPDNGLFHIPKELVENEDSTSHVHVPEVYLNNQHGTLHVPEELANMEHDTSHGPEIFVNNEHGTLHIPEEYEVQEEETTILGA